MREPPDLEYAAVALAHNVDPYEISDRFACSEALFEATDALARELAELSDTIGTALVGMDAAPNIEAAQARVEAATTAVAASMTHALAQLHQGP
jgi:hypothetical protein